MREDGTTGQILAIWPDLIEAIGVIAKDHKAQGVPYKFRSVEDVVARLQPALVKHRLMCAIDTTELHRSSVPTAKGGTMQAASVRVELRFVAPDGTWNTLSAYGEALDSSDKALNKATTAGAKNALLWGLMVATGDHKRDPDSSRPEPSKAPKWSRTAKAVVDQIGKCSSAEEVHAIMTSDVFRQVPKGEAREVRGLAAAAYKRLLKRHEPGGPEDWPEHNFDHRGGK